MPNVNSLLNHILASANLAHPDGRPLYAYPTNELVDRSLQDLVTLVSQRLRSDESLNREESAAFCFTVARQCVPLLRAAPLTWFGLVSEGLGLGEHGTTPVIHDFRNYTEMGLGWWRRALICRPTSIRYLSSLWCEGGGPLYLIHREYGTVQTFFREVLRVHAQYPQQDIDSVIREEEYRLPATLRNDVVRYMVREVVLEAGKLRRRLSAAAVFSNQLSWLDQNETGWRQRWPFALDDETALKLVEALVSERPAGDRLDSSPLIKTTLEESVDGFFVLRRTLALSSILGADHVATLSGMAETDLPTQQWWKLVAAGNEHDAVKLYRRSHGGDFSVVAVSDRGVTGEHATDRVELLCRRGLRELFRLSDLPGNDPLPDGPWVFEQGSAGVSAHYVGAGSYSTRSPTLLLVLPAGFNVVESPSVQKLGFLKDIEPRRAVFQLQGVLEIELDNGVIELKAGAQTPTPSMFSLQGKSITLGSGGSHVWLGLPTLIECQSDGTFMRGVKPDQMQWRAAGTNEWVPITDRQRCLGDIRIRLVENGVVVYRQRLSVLPRDTHVSFLGTDDPSRGRILLRNLGTSAGNVTPAIVDEDMQVRVQGAGGLVVVDVQQEEHGELRPTFRCRMAWDDRRHAELDVAVPVPIVAVFDAAGRRCVLPGPIPVSLLEGLRLRATYPDQCNPVIVDANGVPWAPLARDIGDSTTFSLPLSVIAPRAQNLLSLEDVSDGFLLLHVRKHLITVQGQVTIRIAQTAGRLLTTSENDGQTMLHMTNDLRCQPWFHHAPSFTLHRLIDFEEQLPSDLVQQIDENSWRVDNTHLPAEGALALVRGAGGACVVPRYLSRYPAVPEAAVPIDVPLRYSDILRIGNQGRRLGMWCALLDAMAEDPGHTDWEHVDALLDNAMDLPATTFNVLEALATKPRAAALCALRSTRHQRFWDFMEQLAFLWSMIPITTWLHAVRIFKEHLDAVAPREASTTIRGFCFSACRAMPCMRPVVALLLSDFTGIDMNVGVTGEELGIGGIMPFNPQEFRHGCQWLLNQLITDHDDERWPDAVVPAGGHLVPILDEFGLRDLYGYRKPVVYAPFLAAMRVAHGTPTSRQEVRQIKRCRAFDADWYDQMQQLVTFHIVRQRLTHDPNAYRLGG